MKCRIVELESFTGKEAIIYSVIVGDDNESLFEKFVSDYLASHRKEVMSILNRIEEINHTTGAREHYFKVNEGKPGDGVCALYDKPKKDLRLFCIRNGMVAIILGSGGIKNTKTWQDDPKLNSSANQMIQVSADILQRIKDGEIYWSTDGYKLLGNLNFDDE